MSRKFVSLLLAVVFTCSAVPVFADGPQIDPLDPYDVAQPQTLGEVVLQDDDAGLVEKTLLFLATWSVPWAVIR
ncbi:MAG: hypothetical protein DHS20C21_06970 [Gemmatimonadota bacterium]|nr:MAG: hypothetical protein DHS20C21_06970 [Gemmatimonadota bacterium]